MRGSILMVCEHDGMFADLAIDLRRRAFTVDLRESAKAALDALAAEDYDVIVADLDIDGTDEIELCQLVADACPERPVMVAASCRSLDAATAALRAGAHDLIAKPVEVDLLCMKLERAVEHRRTGIEIRDRLHHRRKHTVFEEILGDCRPMRKVRELLGRVASSDATVLITGETGTGKDAVAHALHRNSSRSGGPFVAVSCAAIPAALLESELFGHTKGSFTDAKTDRAGLLIRASGGTLLLDEVGDLPLELQPKLLRALQERAARPVGAAQEVSFDIRLIAATHQNLARRIVDGRFREDLYYRLDTVQVELPPLRAREGDVLMLAQQFLARYAAQMRKSVLGLSEPVSHRFLAYPWPGNVRQLEHCIERAVALTRHERIVVEDLPDAVRSHRAFERLGVSSEPSTLVTLQEMERRYVRHVLSEVHGNKSMAARILGLDRRTLYRKLAELDPANG